MKYKITRSSDVLKGEIKLTASKSESNRLLIIQHLCSGPIELNNLAKAKDTETLQDLLTQVSNKNSDEELLLDVGPAGTTMRFLTALLSSKKGKFVLTGSARMKERPIGILVDALRALGAKINYLEKEGYPPMAIEGQPLTGGTIQIDGSVSSQYITALLLVAPSWPNGLTLEFTSRIASRPYLDMTLELMRDFGIEFSWQSERILSVSPGNYKSKPHTVEADWSSASYWYEVASFCSEVDFKIEGLKTNSLQGDSVCAELFEHYGVSTRFTETGVHLTKKEQHKPGHLDFDFDHCPDIAQTLAAAACGTAHGGNFTGLISLRIKETDRSLALQQELNKFNFSLELDGDDRVHFKAQQADPATASIATYHDHRMAMAFAPLSIPLGPVVIEDPQVVVKSYPDYWKDLEYAGFQIEEIH